MVYTVDGNTFEGVLETDSGDGLVLLVGSFEGTELPGQLFIPRERVAFVQIPPGEVLR